MNDTPLVVIVDDEDQKSLADDVRTHGVRAIAVSPGDLTNDLLADATLIIVDQYLTRWPERDELDLPVGLNVRDGLALAAVLRAQLDRGEEGSDRAMRAVTIALHSGEVDRLGEGIPRAIRQLSLARQHGIEWVFRKGDNGEYPTDAKIAQLAWATDELNHAQHPSWEERFRAWLRLPSEEWSEDAAWQIEQCRPPQNELARLTAGREWIRWFAQRILPFPTFLIDSISLAMMLGLTHESMEEVVRSDSELHLALSKLQYRGALSELGGARWWRAGVTHFVTSLSDSLGILDSSALVSHLSAIHGAELSPNLVTDPVLTIDLDYHVQERPISATQAVRLQPDGWPPFAEDPWYPLDDFSEELGDSQLAALVILDDRYRFGIGRAAGIEL